MDKNQDLGEQFFLLGRLKRSFGAVGEAIAEPYFVLRAKQQVN
jgi:hypothetical protein